LAKNVVKLLEKLAEKPRQTPKMLSVELGLADSTVNNYLGVMAQLKLIDRVAHGLWCISPLGEKVLAATKEASS